MQSGKFIVVEGPNRAGKTTLIAELVQAYKAAGRTVVSTREPGGTPLGEGLRSVLKNPAMRGGAFATALAFNAARKEHADAVILPALNRGEVVICDRYYPSTEIFQIELGSGMSTPDATLLRALHCSFPQPDLMLFLIPSAEIIRERMNKGGEMDAFEGDERELRAYERYAENFTAGGKSAVIRPRSGTESLLEAAKAVLGAF